MKLKDKILYVAVVAGALFTACDNDKYVDPLVAPAVQVEYIPTTEGNEIYLKLYPSKSVARLQYALGQDGDRESFLDGTMDGITVAEGSDEVEARFTGLQAAEVYTVFAIGYDGEGNPGPLATMKIKTRGPIPAVTATPLFIAEKSAAITIEGNTNFYKYVFALGRPGDRESFEKGVLDGIREKEESSEYTATYFDLDMDSEYVFYLRAYDRLSDQPTPTVEVPLRTAARGTVPAVSVRLDHVDIYSSDYMVTPNEHCKKFCVVATLDGEYDEAFDNEIYRGNVMALFTQWARAGTIATEYQAIPYQFVTPGLLLGDESAFNHPIEFYALVYGDDDSPAGVQRFMFETPAYDDKAGEADATIIVSDIHENGAMYEFIVNEHTMGLVYETVDEEWYEQLLQSSSYYDGYMEDLIFENGYWNYTYQVTRTSFPEASAQPGRNYRVFYMAMNHNGPFGGWGKMKSYSYTTTGTRN